MKKYLLGFSAIVLAIGFSAFTAKKFTSADLIFTAAASTQTNVQDETKYNGSGSSSFVCPSATKEIACKLLAVDEKYTHLNGTNQVILNTSTDNPQSEPILTVVAVQTTGSVYRIDYLTKSDVDGGATHFSTEGTDFTNGAIGN